MWVVSANKQVSFFVFLSFLVSSSRAQVALTDGPTLKIYTSYDIFPPTDVPFGGFVDMIPH